MKVHLVRRWGPHSANQTVEVSDTQGEWLIRHNYAESVKGVQAPEQRAAAEGEHGADPLAGGDATRLRPRVPRSSGSTASQAPGSSPVYRAGFAAEDSKRQGPAGRDYRADEGTQAAQQDAESTKKPRRARRSSES